MGTATTSTDSQIADINAHRRRDTDVQVTTNETLVDAVPLPRPPLPSHPAAGGGGTYVHSTLPLSQLNGYFCVIHLMTREQGASSARSQVPVGNGKGPQHQSLELPRAWVKSGRAVKGGGGRPGYTKHSEFMFCGSSDVCEHSAVCKVFAVCKVSRNR